MTSPAWLLPGDLTQRVVVPVPLRLAIRRWLVVEHLRLARAARDEAHGHRRNRAKVADPTWRERYARLELAAEERAEHHDRISRRWTATLSPERAR